MKIRALVTAGSTMTRSPLRTSTRSRVSVFCSASMGEMLALKKPVPTQRVSSPMMKAANAESVLVMTEGADAAVRTTWPTVEMTMATWMVL